MTVEGVSPRSSLHKKVTPSDAPVGLDSAPSTVAPAASSSSNLAFYLVHINIAFYAFFWWLNQPVLPFLSKELGADNVTFGYFQSFNQFVQLVGAPIIGRVIDVRGAKLALLVSHAVASLSYGLLWQANTVPLLFASQIPTIFMAAMHSSQAYITLISTAEDRARQIGRVSLSYGVGFVFGPMVGGTLSKYIAYNSIALIGSIGSAIVCAALFFLLPNIQPAQREAVQVVADAGAKPAQKNWLAAARLLEVPSVRTIILVKFFLGTALAVYRTSFSLVAKDVSMTHGWASML
jgi:OCT family organic cation transporter-like MFS transporter 18